MAELIIGIAEHAIRIRTESERVEGWMRESFTTLDPQAVSGVDLTLEIQDQWGVPFENFDVDVDVHGGTVRYRRGDYEIRIEDSYDFGWIGAYDLFALKHAMMNVYSALIVHREWGLLIHSSCVAENDQAHIFTGHSGAGKSTVAMLSLPRPLLSDEATVVKVGKDGAVTAFNSPFRSDLWTYHSLDQCPLRGVFFLKQSLEVKTEPMSTVKSMTSLLDKVFYWKYDAGETAKLFRLCSRLTASVPSVELYFQKNDSFWEMIS